MFQCLESRFQVLLGARPWQWSPSFHMRHGEDLSGFHQANRPEPTEKVFKMILTNRNNLFEGPDIMFQCLESRFQVLQGARPWQWSPSFQMRHGEDLPQFHQTNRPEPTEKVFKMILTNPNNLFEGPDIMFQCLESRFQVLHGARPWQKSPSFHMCQGTDLATRISSNESTWTDWESLPCHFNQS